MQIRTLLIILIVVLILGGAWGYAQYRTRKPAIPSTPLDLSLISSDNVNAISISQGPNSAALAVVDSIWQSGGKKVTQGMIDSIWSTFKNIKITGPVSTNPANHERFEVNDSNALTVTFSKDSVALKKLYIGKSAESYSSSYFRVDGNDAVYVADYNLRSLFPTLPDVWYEKSTSTEENL